MIRRPWRPAHHDFLPNPYQLTISQTIETRPRYSLVVDEDVKKPNKQTQTTESVEMPASFVLWTTSQASGGLTVQEWDIHVNCNCFNHRGSLLAYKMYVFGVDE